MADSATNKHTLEQLQQSLDYHFKDTELLITALTHASYARENNQLNKHNQRLEFLGDAILSFILAEELYHTFPEQREGKLTKARSILARGERLTKMARRLKLDQHLRLARHEAKSGMAQHSALLEDAFEALIAALYLDAGLDTTRNILIRLYGDFSTNLQQTLNDHNPKGRLQELMQTQSVDISITYKILSAEGPPHDRLYTAQVFINKEPKGEGSGRSKKEAEEAAARATLDTI